ncbi:hypothetical protein [Ottowia testudinis]|uniref:Uncharacterized protein n=1 Tax=Ottowia testudinis TaxID=2816950 RepID=A0A975H2I2_9BURK|nr:hypothetical protein [Ottowia testudinis]QTD44221.1 hypothetical protein J1M35_13945 [Ottowia testudinis]
MAWHYTTGDKFKHIAACGYLMPTAVGIPAGERPLLWFSLHPRFEPTARKGILDADGVQRAATLTEMMTHAGGLVRFGVPPRGLLTGQTLRRAARIKREDWAMLDKTARDAGANSAQWFGSLDPIAISACAVEVMNDSHEWERGPHS